MPNKFIIPISQWLLLLSLMAAMIFATEVIVQHQKKLARSELLKHEIASANPIRSLIESELNAPLYLSSGLSAYIKANKGNISATEVKLLLKDLVSQGQHIRNIGVAPNNRLLYLHPLQNNHKALGLYYPDLDTQWPAIEEIILKRKAKLAGPIPLVQGGKAFIYRIPVYLIDDDAYWGLISTVINIDSIWQLVAKLALEQNVTIAIRPTADEGALLPAFYGDNSLFYDASLLLDIELRGAKWQMAIRSLSPATYLTATIRIFCYSASAMMLVLLFWLFLSKQRLSLSIQEVKSSKKYIKTVMDNVADGIITTDMDGVIEQANLPCHTIFAYKKDTLPGTHWSTLLAEPGLANDIINTISVQKTAYETTGLRFDGNDFPLAIQLSVIQLNQKPRQIIVLRDLSEWHKTEQLKQQFISTISHELRTPLTSITGALGLIAGGALGELTPAQSRVLQLASNNSQQLNKLINDLLDMEQLTNQSMVFNIQPVPLFQVLAHCLDTVKTQWQEKQHIFTLNITDSLEQASVLADKQRLNNVILQLLNNACKFSPDHSSIIITVTSEPASFIRITIADSGPGIPESFIPKLFNRFAQADSSDTRDIGGTGLGLAISKAMISHMHGQIGYMPNQPKGSCFYIELRHCQATQ